MTASNSQLNNYQMKKTVEKLIKQLLGNRRIKIDSSKFEISRSYLPGDFPRYSVEISANATGIPDKKTKKKKSRKR